MNMIAVRPHHNHNNNNHNHNNNRNNNNHNNNHNNNNHNNHNNNHNNNNNSNNSNSSNNNSNGNNNSNNNKNNNNNITWNTILRIEPEIQRFGGGPGVWCPVKTALQMSSLGQEAPQYSHFAQNSESQVLSSGPP